MAAKRTIDEAISNAALKTLAQMKPEAFVAQLKARGITSLDDLAKNTIATAKGALNSGLSEVDPEVFGVCYKFTVQPHRATTADINAVTKLVQERFLSR
jgi:hypothetical protein